MAATWIVREHSIGTQKVEPFTGEGAYHGSTRQKAASAPRVAAEPVSEARPTTIERYLAAGVTEIASFEASFPNRLDSVARLGVPAQEAVRDDGTTFCWCLFDEAAERAGPLTRSVLDAMRPSLSGKKRHVYVDSKIQYFEPGDLPVDSVLRHVDGSIAVRDGRALRFGVSVLHDLRARLEHGDPPRYLAYQSSVNSATRFVVRPVRLRLPELVPDFNGFDAAVRAAGAAECAHPAGAILAYDGNTIHCAVPAASAGWRLWLRCTETDVEIRPSEAIVACYGTVFRPAR